MDRKEAQKLRVELNKVLELFDSNYTATVGNCKFSPVDAEFKVTLLKKGDVSREEHDLARYADMYDVDPNKIGDFPDGQHSLIGFNTSARKNIFIIQKLSTGDKFTIDQYVARKYFGKDHKENTA